MAAAFQTIPTADPSESAFVITIDDTVVNPTNIPAAGSRFADWELGQKFRDDSLLWANYVLVDAVNSSPGTRAFVFGKKKTAAEKLIPFETYHDSELYNWPAVVERIRNVSYEQGSSSVYSVPNYAIKSAVNFESVVKIETFQDAEPWPLADLQHRKPIPDELMLNDSDRPITCLHPKITVRIAANFSSTYGGFVKEDPMRKPDLTYPATNFTNWSPFVLRDGQKKSNGLYVRQKVTIFPPIQSTRKFL